MAAIVLCIFACVVTYWAGRRSLGAGIVSLLAFGYAYGIVRANLPTSFSHFIFDAAMLGLYVARKNVLFGQITTRNAPLKIWIAILLLWPVVLVFIPSQPLLIQLVGLRGSIFFLPMALLGAELGKEDLRVFSMGLASLNLAALGFSVAEYFLGIQRFFPVSEVTAIIYGSNDVAGGFNRIPAVFGTAHLYGGMMTISLPFLIGGWQSAESAKGRAIAIAGLVAAFMGVLFSATRLNFVASSLMVLLTVTFGKMGWKRQMAFFLVLAGIGAVALHNERFQRFETLKDTDFVQERIAGSVNRNILEILTQYPLGNGLGGGGTSIPYFLQGQVRNPISTENEYGRISLEQGLLGLILWLSFVVWFGSRYGATFGNNKWAAARKLVWLYSLFSFICACLGTGLLTAIPLSAIFMLGVGWVAVPVKEEARLPLRKAKPRAELRPVRIISTTPV